MGKEYLKDSLFTPILSFDNNLFIIFIINLFKFKLFNS
jgi:hypothetical protein